MSKFENNQIKMEMVDGILYATYKAGFNLTLKDVQEIVHERVSLLQGNTVPVLIIDAGVVSMDKAARDYLSSDEGTQGIKAAAIIENSFFSKMLINFFLKLTNPKIKVKAFNDKEEALKWLKSN